MLKMMIAVGTKRILVIDHEPNMRQIVLTCLRTIGGWQTLAASTAQDGLVKAEVEQPDVIILEGMNLDMSVAVFLQQLRDNPKTASIPVIFLTAQPHLTERHRFLALGAVGAIAKPFDPLTLVPKIATTLGWNLRE
jgi:two-component system, OmpR family, response regulator